VYSNATSDNRILRMSRAAGVDLTPLIQFWGVKPFNTTSLKAAMMAEGLLPSAAIYDRIERYRNIVPRSQAAFDAHAVAVSSASRDTAWYTAQKTSYDLSVGTGAVTKVQQILDLHFPGGRPGSAPPANSVIYTEDFNGGTIALNAKAPTTGDGAWIANPIVSANGVLTADAGSAVLRFDPVPNKTYTVSLDFNYSGGSGGWFGLGFSAVSPWVTSASTVADRFSNLNVPGNAWMLTGQTSLVGAWEGPGTTNAIPFSNLTLTPGPHTMKVVIDTTGNGSSFTADFLIDGISITGGPKVVDATTVEDINYVGFTQYGGGLLTGSTVNNFSVSTSPSPPAPDPNYTEVFDGGGAALNGKVSTTGEGVWSANSLVTGNGVLTADAGSALLPFTPVADKIYTLSLDFNYSSGSGGWLGLGFSSSTAVSSPAAGSTGDRLSNANAPGYAWMISNGNSIVGVWQGSQTNNPIPYTSPTLPNGSHRMRIVLNTAGDGSSFTADYFIGRTSVTNGPVTINVPLSTLKSVGFSQNGSGMLTGSIIDNFSFSTADIILPTYATWATANGITGEPAAGDFDNDGLANLVEYALGLDPKSSSGPPGTFTGGVLRFVKGVEAVTHGDVTYAIEISDDLGVTDPWVEVLPDTDDSTEISYELPSGPGQTEVFARLKIVQAP
jgi:hypothetical protein